MHRRKRLVIWAQNQISADQAGLAVKTCLLQLHSPREGCDAGFFPNYDAQEAEAMSVLE